MFNATGVSDGYGIGNALIIRAVDLNYTPKTNCNPDEEIQRFKEAYDAYTQKTKQTAEKIRISAGEKESEIISSHILMIEDPYMQSEIKKNINNGMCAEKAFEEVCNTFIMVFESADDELTKERASDVKDIKTAILSILLGKEETDISSCPPNTILIANDMTPSMTALINKDNIAGIITESGGITSHCAILARAMEIPAVMGLENATDLFKDGQMLIIDGQKGLIFDNPDNALTSEYKNRQKEYTDKKALLKNYIGKETITSDGIKFELAGNIGTPKDADNVLQCDGEGIGLFRTEFLFMHRNSLPTEDEQYEAYKQVALKFKDKPVIIRTLDIGGDKEIPYLGLTKEENPFLGFRAVRYCLKNNNIFRQQLNALLRASAYGNIKILIPLVTCVDEVISVKKIICELMSELDKKSIAYNSEIKLGVMIETPASCLIADILAKEADFFSIGTNDLTQYIMSVDRGNNDVAYLYSPFNPSVLRAIRHTIHCAQEAGIPVGMCGEAAADRRMIPLLLSFGLTEFSVNPVSILSVRKEISEWTKEKADELCNKVMSLTSESEIRELLEETVF